MDRPTLTDSGLETWLVFHRGIDLPHFAAFPLLDDVDGRAALATYFRAHLEIAAEADAPIVLETPTWRANPDWGSTLGYDHEGLDRVNRSAVSFIRELASEFPAVTTTVSGNLGPRGDGYSADTLLTPEDSAAYHRRQIESFANAGADRVTIVTATHAGEATGVVLAASVVGIPVVVSFTVETDGRLPSGQPLADAIEQVDASTGAAALHFGINCAHPDHFSGALSTGAPSLTRIGLVRANASRASHAELDEAEELDDGDPDELAALYAQLIGQHRHIHVLGGCCGTDPRHIRAIADTCLPSTAR